MFVPIAQFGVRRRVDVFSGSELFVGKGRLLNQEFDAILNALGV